MRYSKRGEMTALEALQEDHSGKIDTTLAEDACSQADF